jgi:uncharacterized protein (TIGR00299 family) protein
MNIAFFDTFSGISGDMTLGALVHLGVPIEHIRSVADALSLADVAIDAEPRTLNGIVGTKVRIVDRAPDSRGGHRAYAEIRALLDAAPLSSTVRARSQRVFATLAEAEGRVHGVPAARVHFHEVGAVDSLIDIVGTAAGLDHLDIDDIYVGPLPLGRGTVNTQHGALPIPAPATIELLRGWSVRPDDGDTELVTPTGAAIVAALATPGAAPAMCVRGTGYGCGDRVLSDRPNMLRIVLGEVIAEAAHDEVVCLEANVDDLPPELFEHAMEQLFAAGARDVFFTAIQMKKNRPATLISVLGDPADRDRLAGIIFRETSTIGVRYALQRRAILARETQTVETPYGPVAVRVARAPDGTINAAPEYESCRQIAETQRVPLKLIYRAAIAAYERC